jgi:cytoskeletal protein RodZ
LAGEIFKKKREELGIDIKEASDILKIGSEYLLAIENDIFDRLPVAVYTIGYIRCYAKYLDVDAGPVIANFTSHLSSPEPSTIIPVSSSRRKVPGYTYVALAFLAGLLIFFVYMYASKNRAGDLFVENSRTPGTEIKPAETPRLDAGAASVSPSRDNDAPESGLTVTGQAPEDKKEHRLVIMASDTVWVQIRYENGKLEEALLRSGMLKDWSFSDTAVLKVGNAGGITLEFDGNDLGVPGKPGQVLNLNFPPGKVTTEAEVTAQSSQQ